MNERALFFVQGSSQPESVLIFFFILTEHDRQTDRLEGRKTGEQAGRQREVADSKTCLLVKGLESTWLIQIILLSPWANP